MVTRDLYKILGVTPLTGRDEIHRVYRALAKKYHPDIAKEKILAEEKMKEIVEAYETLYDLKRRKDYDSQKRFQFRENVATRRPTKTPKMQEKRGFLQSLSSIFKKEGTPKKPKKGKIDLKEKPKQPRGPEFHFSMGLSYCVNRTKEYISCARDEFERVVELDPNNANAHYNLGLCYYLVGEYDKAIACFKRVTVLKSGDSDARVMAASLLEE